MRFLPALLFTLLFISSCISEDPVLTSEEEIVQIEEYINSNNLSTQLTDSGLYYQITGPQNGAEVNFSFLSVFTFKQFLLDGTIIVNAETTPVSAFPDQLVPGLAEAFEFLRKGDTGIFLMPSNLAFGPFGGGGVPASTPVGFEITLLECHPDLFTYELSQIQRYLVDNNLSAESNVSGLHYIIEEPGEGDHPAQDARVEVHYRGFLLDGTVFDQTNDAPLSISLDRVISGWQEGIPLFKRGGRGLLLIPSAIAYGVTGQGGIPPNTPIAFEIELVDFD